MENQPSPVEILTSLAYNALLTAKRIHHTIAGLQNIDSATEQELKIAIEAQDERKIQTILNNLELKSVDTWSLKRLREFAQHRRIPRYYVLPRELLIKQIQMRIDGNVERNETVDPPIGDHRETIPTT